MKQLLIFFVAVSIFGCIKDPECEPKTNTESDDTMFLVTESDSLFNGILEIYPSEFGKTEYFGNYVNNTLSIFLPTYAIDRGRISSISVPFSVPNGHYTMVYWGISDFGRDPEAAVLPPTVTFGFDFLSSYWSLRRKNNTPPYIYATTWDLGYAVSKLNVGSDKSIHVVLNRVVSALNIEVKNSGGIPFVSDIVSFKASVNKIAPKVGFMDGAPDFSSGTVTVDIPMTLSTDRRSAKNTTSLFFPSQPNPELTIEVALGNGSKRQFTYILSSPFEANHLKNVTLTIDQTNDPFSNATLISVVSWTEKTTVMKGKIAE